MRFSYSARKRIFQFINNGPSKIPCLGHVIKSMTYLHKVPPCTTDAFSGDIVVTIFTIRLNTNTACYHTAYALFKFSVLTTYNKTLLVHISLVGLSSGNIAFSATYGLNLYKTIQNHFSRSHWPLAC